jgi:hypothetical protein
MKTGSELPANKVHPASAPPRSGFFQPPSTRPGWVSVGLAVLFVILYIAVVIVNDMSKTLWGELAVNLYLLLSLLMPLSGLATCVASLIAIVRKHERSWLVWLASLAGLIGALLVFANLAPGGH